MTYSTEYQHGYSELSPPAATVGTAYLRPLRRWLIISLGVGVLLICRDIIWKTGVELSPRVTSAVLSPLLVLCLFRASTLASRTFPYVQATFGLFGRLHIMGAWVVALAVYGILYGNLANAIYKDTCGFFTLILLMRLSVYDAVWQILLKPLLVLVLLGTVLVVTTSSIQGVQTTVTGTNEIKDADIPRHLDTLGYAIRGILTPALLLGALGLVAVRNNRWKALMLLSFFLYAGVLALLFEFRGVLVNIVAILLVFMLLSPVASGRIPLGTIIGVLLLLAVGAFVATSTGAAGQLANRFAKEQLLKARLSEADAFFTDMGPVELVLGRGMGGTYNGPEWAPREGRRFWSANHFGILAFVLRGGVPFALFLSLMAFPVLIRHPASWYQHELNLAAMVLAPMVIVGILINPFSVQPDSVFDLLVWAFCFGRFAAPVNEESQWETTAPAIDSGY